MLGPGRPVGVSSCGSAFSWSAWPVTLACVRVIGLQLGCPLDDQAAVTHFFGFVSSTYGSKTLLAYSVRR